MILKESIISDNKYIFFHLLEIVIENSRIIYQQVSRTHISLLDFREHLLRQMLMDYSSRKIKYYLKQTIPCIEYRFPLKAKKDDIMPNVITIFRLNVNNVKYIYVYLL